MTGDHPTIQAFMAAVTRDLGGRLWRTFDAVKIGNVKQPIAGVVTTFLTTVPVIKHAAVLNANLIITPNRPLAPGWL